MSRPQNTGPNPLEMSDEDFMKMNGPDSYIPAEEEPAEEEPAAETPAEEEDAEGAEAPEADSDDGEEGEEASEEESEEDPEGNENTPGADPEGKTPEEISDNAESSEGEDGDKPKEAGKDGKKDTAPKESESEPDYKAFYSMIMGGFRANGKTIELKDPQEALQLMQMGANYTQKMQAIQPHRKMLLMLQKNEIDSGKLSFAIDLLRKDPEAIRKLIKDAGIDPMDIDTESEPEYRGGNHEVSDEEEAFRGVMEEVASTDAGKATLQEIQRTWDQTSKDLLWAQPEVLSIIHQQRENGIYARITAEMDRRKALGSMPVSTPFMQAYQTIGNELQQAGAFADIAQSEQRAPTPVQRKATERPAKPKPKVANGEQAKAAASSRRSSRTPTPIVNPLAMSDEEFMKMDALKTRV